MKLISWNLNGIRAVVKKGLHEMIYDMNPDVIGFQETKANDEQVRQALFGIEGYHVYSNSAIKKGYSGTCILTKKEPIRVLKDIGIKEHDTEGRVLGVEFEEFYFITVYVPNSGGQLLRLSYRETWDKAFLSYLTELEKTKPVIVCGDFNVAHKDMDLKNPKSNYNKNPGYMQEEIDGFNNFLNANFIDTFRHLNKEQIKYSWWSYRANARIRNVGWRIDYLLSSKSIIDKIDNAFILNDVFGSDHCPVGADISL